MVCMLSAQLGTGSEKLSLYLNSRNSYGQCIVYKYHPVECACHSISQPIHKVRPLCLFLSNLHLACLQLTVEHVNIIITARSVHTLTQITFTFVTHLDKTRNPKRCVVYFRHLFHPQNSCLYTDFLINRYSTSDSNLNSLKTEKMSYNEMCSDGKHSILQNYYYRPISSLPVTIVGNGKKCK